MSAVRLVNYGGYGWPTCDVCNKDVEHIESTWDINRDARRFRVLCHGEWEEAELTPITEMDAVDVSFGRAFVRPRLEVRNDSK